MTSRQTGEYKKIADTEYFLPFPLPPKEPKLELSQEIISLYGEASFRLGKLNEMSRRVPDLNRFVKAYVIKEALISSAIEGIETTIFEVFTKDIVSLNKIDKDTQLVLNYTAALESAVNMIKKENLPISNRVICRSHTVLLSAGEGDRADPGNYRKQAVKVGNLVPPPATEIENLMGELERYINLDNELPAIIKSGLVHVHFETIHPFLDGNGRIGRLLIVLMLLDNGILEFPLIYPSYYFKKNRLEYYQKLDAVRTTGDYEGWIIFYLKGLIESAKDAHLRAVEIEELESFIKDSISEEKEFTKIRENAKLFLENLFSYPITSLTEISKRTSKAYNTVINVLDILQSKGWIEIGNEKRGKICKFVKYLEILDKEY